MLKYCEVENTIITNIFVADEVFVNQYKPQAIACPDYIGVGDKYNNGVFERLFATPVIEE